MAWHNTTWTADRAIDWLKREHDNPFCLWVSFPDPHHPFDCPEPWSRLHHPDEVDLPPYRERDLDRRPWWHRAALESEPAGAPERAAIRKSYSRIAPQSDRQLREIIANTYGMVSLIDHNVGRILIALDELGLADDTIVIFTADHGDWLGDHGLILKGPMPYEGLLRVGLILRGPGIPKDKIIDDPVSTLDLGATFIDYAGASALQTQHGTSLRPLVEGRGNARAFARSEWELHPQRAGVALSLRTVRTKTHKLTVELRSGDGELYDLVNDPHERENRFADAGYAALRASLMDMIRSRPDDAGPIREPVGMA